MYARTFNSVMCPVNELWAANVLGMEMNPRSGIDLLGDSKNVEVKFTLQYLDKYKHKSWRVLDHELAFQNGKPCFWALGFYTLKEEISRINVKTQLALERRVIDRELFIVPWEWMSQFPRYHHVGQTKKSKWDHWIRFPKHKDLPPNYATYPVKGGIVHLTQGVPEYLFQDIKSTPVPTSSL